MNNNDQAVPETPIQELRKIRDEHAERFNCNISDMFEDIKKFARDQNLKTVSPKIKHVDKKTGS